MKANREHFGCVSTNGRSSVPSSHRPRVSAVRGEDVFDRSDGKGVYVATRAQCAAGSGFGLKGHEMRPNSGSNRIAALVTDTALKRIRPMADPRRWSKN